MREEEINKLWELLEKAERRLSFIAEDSEDGIDAAALNELRYAFFHTVKALRDSTIAKSEFEKAIKHITRAIYDCYEIEVYNHLNTFRVYAEAWRNLPVPVSEVEPAWAEWCLVMDDLKRFRREVQRDTREQYTLALEKKLELSRPIVSKLKYVNEDLKKKAYVVKREKSVVVWSAVAALAGVAAVAVTLIFRTLDNSEIKFAPPAAGTQASEPR